MTSLGKYELHEQLGKGGFGTVYRATDTSLNRVVALKVLHPQLMVDETFIERFRREAQTLASLEHPNIVTIYEMGEIDARVFIAMRYLPGGNLQQVLNNQGPLSYEKALLMMRQICEGLQAAHDLGLVHRDIKPANILFDARGNVVISDFGLARAVQLSDSTSGGAPAGTPAYRAPELWRGKPPASPATDVYSLGCIFTEMLSGRVLFNGETPDEILTQHLIDGPMLPEKWPHDMPVGLPAALKRALSKDPVQRQKDAASFFTEIAATNWVEPEITGEIDIQAKQDEPGIVHTIAPDELEKSAPLVIPPTAESRILVRDETTKKIEVSPGLEMEFLLVPGGEFLMGSDARYDPLAFRFEMPQHRVYLDEYRIGKYPVTVAQYRVFLEETKLQEPDDWKWQLKSIHKNYPVVNVSWMDATAYCRWLGKKCKQAICLPTEAQWEKAARGTDGRIYPWGNEPPDSKRANYYRWNWVKEGPSTVGSCPAGASPYGALDMAGNVWEWVADWFGDYNSNNVTNPPGPKSGSKYGNIRVLRGGSWRDLVDHIRSANRCGYDPDLTDSYGFRCAMSASEVP